MKFKISTQKSKSCTKEIMADETTTKLFFNGACIRLVVSAVWSECEEIDSSIKRVKSV